MVGCVSECQRENTHQNVDAAIGLVTQHVVQLHGLDVHPPVPTVPCRFPKKCFIFVLRQPTECKCLTRGARDRPPPQTCYCGSQHHRRSITVTHTLPRSIDTLLTVTVPLTLRLFYGCFLMIEAHGGRCFRTPCPNCRAKPFKVKALRSAT